MAGARGGRSPETVPIQSVSLELFIAISVACGDICPPAAGPACRRGPPSPRNTCCAAQNRVVPIARRGPGRKTRPARPPCCGWPASWSISPSRGRKNSRVTRLCARTWLEFRAAALKSPSRGRPGRQGFSADTDRRILSHVGLGQSPSLDFRGTKPANVPGPDSQRGVAVRVQAVRASGELCSKQILSRMYWHSNRNDRLPVHGGGAGF